MVLQKYIMIQKKNHYGVKNISYLMVIKKENTKNITRIDNYGIYVIIEMIIQKENINHIMIMDNYKKYVSIIVIKRMEYIKNFIIMDNYMKYIIV